MSDEFELELESMAHGGSSLGRHAGQVVFVPYTIPGERILARITETRGRVAFAQGVTLLDASADRVFPECPHFGPGRCGGCQWQHIDPAAQRLLKQDVLADQLERVGRLPNADVRPVIAASADWHYNHHMTFQVGPDGRLGFPSTHPNRVEVIDVCYIIHPELLDLYKQLDLVTANLSAIQVRRGADGARMVVLYAAEEEAPEMELNFPASVNLVLPDNEPLNLAGDSLTWYVVGERRFRSTAGTMFRANVDALPKLVETVLAGLDGALAVLDLYSGVGTLGAFIAEEAEYVTLVESYPPAATDADENTAEFEHVDVLEGTVEDVLEVTPPGEYDAAVLDPPGEGLSVEVIDALGALALPRLVYVSGDPATLARDAARLVKQGYNLAYVQPVELAPQTYYIDSVAVFTR